MVSKHFPRVLGQQCRGPAGSHCRPWQTPLHVHGPRVGGFLPHLEAGECTSPLETLLPKTHPPSSQMEPQTKPMGDFPQEAWLGSLQSEKGQEYSGLTETRKTE